MSAKYIHNYYPDHNADVQWTDLKRDLRGRLVEMVEHVLKYFDLCTTTVITSEGREYIDPSIYSGTTGVAVCL